MFTVCQPTICRIFAVCPPYVRRMSAAYSPYARRMYAIPNLPFHQFSSIEFIYYIIMYQILRTQNIPSWCLFYFQRERYILETRDTYMLKFARLRDSISANNPTGVSTYHLPRDTRCNARVSLVMRAHLVRVTCT